MVASLPLLSEHEIQELGRMTPQQQAELLLERAINHISGLRIGDDLAAWRGWYNSR